MFNVFSQKEIVRCKQCGSWEFEQKDIYTYRYIDPDMPADPNPEDHPFVTHSVKTVIACIYCGTTIQETQQHGIKITPEMMNVESGSMKVAPDTTEGEPGPLEKIFLGKGSVGHNPDSPDGPPPAGLGPTDKRFKEPKPEAL